MEKDFLGDVDVPSRAYYGSFTARAMRNFDVSGLRVDRELIRALAEVKKAAASANAELGLLDRDLAGAIGRAADEIILGGHAGEFPIDVFQAGAGTPWNMNVNEVISNRANELLGRRLGAYSPIHPNDHVNMGQSSNDTVPTAMRVAAIRLSGKIVSGLRDLEFAFEVKAAEFQNILKSGRTHLRDAVPITLGQEFHTYAVSIAEALAELEATERRLRRVPIGGTAVGTGVGTHPRYRVLVTARLGEITGLDLEPMEDTAYGIQQLTDFLVYVNALGVLAATMIKIGNDLMLLSSGPATGFAEINLPPVEPGSSIMPGKVNPSIVECVNMVCLQTLGVRAIVEAAAQHGTLDLNVYTPLVAYNLLSSQRWMDRAVHILRERCVVGIEPNVETARHFFEESNAFATLLVPRIGYDAASRLAIKARTRKVTIERLAIEEGLITEQEFKALVESSTHPNVGESSRRVKED